MIKAKSLFVTFLLFSLIFYCVAPSIAYSEQVLKEIESEATARDIAVKAEGTYIEGAAAPTLSGSEVALPIIEESTGNVLGYIVADQIKLISVLNDMGLIEVASAIAAGSVGAAAGTAAGTGFALGTTGMIAAAAAGVGLIVAVSSTSSH